MGHGYAFLLGGNQLLLGGIPAHVVPCHVRGQPAQILRLLDRIGACGEEVEPLRELLQQVEHQRVPQRPGDRLGLVLLLLLPRRGYLQEGRDHMVGLGSQLEGEDDCAVGLETEKVIPCRRSPRITS